MFTKAIIIIVMLIIVGALASGIVFLAKDEGKSKRTVKALTWRIVLSISLFLFLFIAFAFGLIEPHSL